MLKIYGADLSSVSNKVRFCANIIGLEYEYVYVKVAEGEHKSEEHLSRHPAGKIPAIDDDGFTLFESDAICKYFALKNNSTLYPKDIKEQAVVDQWNAFISIHVQGAYGRVLYNKFIAPKFGMDVDENSLKCGWEFLDRFLPVIGNQINDSYLLIGDKPTIADVNLIATTDPSEAIELDLSKYPKLKAKREKVKATEWYQKVHKFYGESMLQQQ